MAISKRFLERARPALKKYQRIFADAHTRDVNESDTCVIIADFLSDVLGYDKYSELTTEFAIKSTFCDLAIKLGGKVTFLIEVKSIGSVGSAKSTYSEDPVVGPAGRRVGAADEWRRLAGASLEVR